MAPGFRSKKINGIQWHYRSISCRQPRSYSVLTRKELEKLSGANGFKITGFGKANFIEDVFPFSFFAKRTVLQKIDCKIADMLPYQLTGGFFMVWEKSNGKLPNS